MKLGSASALSALIVLGCATSVDVDPNDEVTPGPPDTEIFVVSVGLDQNGRPRLGTPVNLTNRPGYDNQPAFTASGDLLYTRMDDQGATDIWMFPSGSTTSRQVTNTAESEYSPLPLSSGSFRVVRVEADEKQRLWNFGPDGAPSLVAPELEPVGYHALAGESIVAFILGDPPTLVVSDGSGTNPRTVSENPGRALIRLGDDRVAFVQKSEEARWEVIELDLGTNQLKSLALLPAGREDFTVDPDGSLWTGEGSKLLRWNRSMRRWDEIADYAGTGIREITRLTFDRNGSRLAFVAER